MGEATPASRSPRGLAAAKGLGREDGFRWRGDDVSRIEGLSDAIFGFAVTLLVVSLEVPHTYDQLLALMRGLPAFGICFALLLILWYEHYLFFRRYALADMTTIVLNGILLFVVLFYIYPLKFLFSLLVGEILGFREEGLRQQLTISQASTLMLVYSLGSLAVFTVFALLYVHAYRQRAALELTPIETFDTVSRLQYHGIYIAVALLSIGLVILERPARITWAGLAYFLLGPACAFHGWVRGRKGRLLLEAG